MKNKINLPGFTGEIPLSKINLSYQNNSDDFSKLQNLQIYDIIPQEKSTYSSYCDRVASTRKALDNIASIFGSWITSNPIYLGLSNDNTEALNLCKSFGTKDF